MKINPALFGLSLALAIVIGSVITRKNETRSDNRSNVLRMEIVIVKDYKRVYLEHIEKCDTLHIECFKLRKERKK